MNGPTPYPTLRQSLVLALLVLPLVQLLLLPWLGDEAETLALVLAELSLLALAGLSIRRRRWVAEDVLLLNAAPWTGFVLVVPLALTAGLLAGEIDLRVAALWHWLDWPAPLGLQRSSLSLQIAAGALDAARVVAVVGVLPAICEELFFRGFVYTGLRYHHGPRAAWIGSAFVFAAAHLNPWQFPAFFALGLFLGWLVHRTHSVYPAILAHGLNNLLSIVAVNVRTHLGIDPLGALAPVEPIVLLGALALFAAGVITLRRTVIPIMPILSRQGLPSNPSAPSLTGLPQRNDPHRPGRWGSSESNP